MRKYILLLLIFGGAFVLHAQNSNKKQLKANLGNEKIVMFSRIIGLTQEQSPAFWSVYNKYQKDKSDLSLREKNLIREGAKSNLSEDRYKQIYSELEQIKKDRVVLETKFSQDMDKILSPQQKVLLLKASQEYKEMLLKKLNKQQKTSR